MKMLTLCLTMLASSGCLMSRSLVLPDATPMLDAPEITARWGVTELFVRSRNQSANEQRNWSAELNGYSRTENLARESGAAVPELEQRLLETLREVLREATLDSAHVSAVN